MKYDSITINTQIDQKFGTSLLIVPISNFFLFTLLLYIMIVQNYVNRILSVVNKRSSNPPKHKNSPISIFRNYHSKITIYEYLWSTDFDSTLHNLRRKPACNTRRVRLTMFRATNIIQVRWRPQTRGGPSDKKHAVATRGGSMLIEIIEIVKRAAERVMHSLFRPIVIPRGVNRTGKTFVASRHDRPL